MTNCVNEPLVLPYQSPFEWDELLSFFERRALPGVERVQGGEYWRIVDFSAGSQSSSPVTGWIKVGHDPKKRALTVTASASLSSQSAAVANTVSHLFDLNHDPQKPDHTLASMTQVHPQLPIRGLRVPGTVDSFELAVRAIIGQQITVKAARTILGRFVGAYGRPSSCELPELDTAFPAALDILALPGDITEHLGPLGVTKTRANAIRSIALMTELGGLDLKTDAPAEEYMAPLLGIKGIGPWTAGYIAMRAGGLPDVLLTGDSAVRTALTLTDPGEVAFLAESWRPWRSYATMNLWTSLNRQGG